MQRISIKNLGPIIDYEMEINKLNLLIGEQASGKSTISKCIFFFRTIKSEIAEYLFALSSKGKERDNNRLPKSLNRPLKDTFVQLFGYSWDLNENLELYYKFTPEINIKVTLAQRENGKKYISVQYSTALVSAIKNLEKDMLELYKTSISAQVTFTFATTERLRLHQEIVHRINEIFNDDLETYYIPAGRGLLTLMANQKTKLDYDTIDLVNRKFMQFIENIQAKFDLGIEQVHKYYPVNERKFDVSKITDSIMTGIKGDYKYSKGNEYFIAENSQDSIPINFASSGQQEVLWLFNQLYVLMLRNEKAFVIIEEPEAHLYPTLQKEILEFIIQFANINNSSIFLTTHSPYILTATNALYYAGKLYEEGKKQEINKIVGRYKHIFPNQLSIYKLNSSKLNNQTEDLIDKSIGEIKTELIDEVSDKVNELYTKLFYLEELNNDSSDKI